MSPVELTRQYRTCRRLRRDPNRPSSLPRCDDSILKARGECIDDTAGVRPVKPGETLPSNLAGVVGATPRELLFNAEKEARCCPRPRLYQDR